MQKKNYVYASLVSLNLLASTGCAGLKVPDVPLCVEINPAKGNCVKIISGDTFDIDEENKFEEKTWWEIRPAMVQVPESSWREIKKFIITICKKTNQCQKEVKNWERSVKQIDTKLKEKENGD